MRAASPGTSRASPRSTITAINARVTDECSPMKPMPGGPAKNAQYAIDETTLTGGKGGPADQS